MNNIKHLLDVVDKVRDHMALGLMSDPGLSKTSQVKQWAEENSRTYYELILSQRMPSEISGMPMPVEGTKKMEIFDFDTLLLLKEGDVLAFDEFTNGNIQTLNACLTLIQERFMLSGKKLPSIIIVAMGNPQGRCDLLPQTKQRFWWVDVKFDEKCWKKYIQDIWHMNVDKILIDKINDQYRDGFQHSDYNYWTPRTVETLIRIAIEIPKEDSFWEVSRITNRVRDAFYRTIESKGETFPGMKEELLAWCHKRQKELHLKDFTSHELDVLHNSVFNMNDFSDLYNLISDINDGKYGDIGKQFLAFTQEKEPEAEDAKDKLWANLEP